MQARGAFEKVSVGAPVALTEALTHRCWQVVGLACWVVIHTGTLFLRWDAPNVSYLTRQFSPESMHIFLSLTMRFNLFICIIQKLDEKYYKLQHMILNYFSQILFFTLVALLD